jgi:hypothetical protein
MENRLVIWWDEKKTEKEMVGTIENDMRAVGVCEGDVENRDE